MGACIWGGLVALMFMLAQRAENHKKLMRKRALGPTVLSLHLLTVGWRPEARLAWHPTAGVEERVVWTQANYNLYSWYSLKNKIISRPNSMCKFRHPELLILKPSTHHSLHRNNLNVIKEKKITPFNMIHKSWIFTNRFCLVKYCIFQKR